MNNNPAPVVLFVYNRPEHTRLTVEALLKNDLSNECDLIVYSDAPKSDADTETVNEVRRYVHHVDGFKSVTIVERESNFGLARSIIDGVTSVVNTYGRVIVLEDDLSVSPFFLEFMNSALNIYEYEDRVMHVSGYMFPIDDLETTETFFFRGASCWGWATWSRAWKNFEPDTKKLLDGIRTQKLGYEFDVQGTIGYTEMLENQLSGSIDSWAVRWYASVFLNGGTCLHPVRSLVNNIGHDGTGVHCGSSDSYRVDVANVRPIVVKQEIKEHAAGLMAVKKFFGSLKQPFYIRIYSALTRLLKRRVRG